GTLVTPCHVMTSFTCVRKNNGIKVYIGEHSVGDDVEVIDADKPRLTNKALGVSIFNLATCVDTNAPNVDVISVIDSTIPDGWNARWFGWGTEHITVGSQSQVVQSATCQSN
ncbi:unnamed protein product, partial [Owenia fusiformis]